MIVAPESVALFEAARPRLTGLAYRMLGSLADAEDVVSEVWLRWQRTPLAGIDRPEAWLTTVTTRTAIDWGRSLQRRREAYVGPWLPEPLVADAPGPEAVVELAESLSLGFLVLLDRLDPLSRAVVVLADVWAWSFAEIAVAVGRSDAACRQLASRARRRMREGPTWPPSAAPSSPSTGSPAPTGVANSVTAARPTPGEVAGGRRVVDDLVEALVNGDVEATMALLAPEVVLVSDGGATTHAARRPVVTPFRVARLMLNLTGRLGEEPEARAVSVNGAPGLAIASSVLGEVVLAFELGPSTIRSIWVFRAPEKLRRLHRPPVLV